MRLTALLLACAALGAAPAPEPDAASAGFVEAVEFPYYLYPASAWERELVWLKGIGVRTVEFPIPWNWHQLGPDDFDFTGRTSPRRNLAGFIRLLGRLKLTAWVRPLPPVAGWLNGGWPAGTAPGAAGQRAWLEQLRKLLSAHTASHGGPVAYVETRGQTGIPGVDAGPPPGPVAALTASDPASLARSRDAIAGLRGSLLWTGVEDALYPAGWAANPSTRFRKGMVSLSGDERIPIGALRRDAALLRNWGALFPRMRRIPLPKSFGAGLPEGVRVSEMVSPAGAAVSVWNAGKKPFEGDLRVLTPGSRRAFTIPGVRVAAGESLWLPLGISLGANGLCRECSNFSPAENIVYATAELEALEYENGILAMEFAAPQAGEVVLQLAREPVGPYLAAGKLIGFEWDEKTLRARLIIPASSEPGSRVRIGIAMDEPDASAFFNEARRLLIGRANVVSTVYSSADLAARSRLRMPEGFTSRKIVKSPNEIDYEVNTPADAVHGDWADFRLEADGMPLGRARVQLFRPVSVRLAQPMEAHFGRDSSMVADPPTAIVDPRGGGIEIVLRNNSQEIQTYHLEPTGDGLDFFPPKTDVAVGAVDERTVSLRVFAHEGVEGLRDWRLRITGGATAEIPMRAVALPRERTLAWSADLDGDGSPEWVLESRTVRAVFSSADGGRWTEFTWKGSGQNFLPEQGMFASSGAVEVRPAGDALRVVGKNWTRTVRLSGATLTVEQSTQLPADQLPEEKLGNVKLTVERASQTRASFSLAQDARQ